MAQATEKKENDKATKTFVVNAINANKERSSFDYNSLPEEKRRLVKENADKIDSLLRKTTESIIEIGKYLSEVKDTLKHGEYLRWLKSEFPNFTRSTSSKWVQVYHKFKSFEAGTLNLSPTVMYELAANAVPSEAIEEAVELSQKKTVTVDAARAIKSKYISTRNTNVSTGKQKEEEIEIVKAEIVEGKESTQKVKVISEAKQDIVGIIKRQTLWQVSGHTVVCCEPNSSKFISLLTEEISLVLSFPIEKDWQFEFKNYVSINSFYNKYKEQDQFNDTDYRILFELSAKAIELSTVENDKVAILFIPHPQILLLLESFELKAFIVDPDYEKCVSLVEATAEKNS